MNRDGTHGCNLRREISSKILNLHVVNKNLQNTGRSAISFKTVNFKSSNLLFRQQKRMKLLELIELINSSMFSAVCAD